VCPASGEGDFAHFLSAIGGVATYSVGLGSETHGISGLPGIVNVGCDSCQKKR